MVDNQNCEDQVDLEEEKRQTGRDEVIRAIYSAYVQQRVGLNVVEEERRCEEEDSWHCVSRRAIHDIHSKN